VLIFIIKVDNRFYSLRDSGRAVALDAKKTLWKATEDALNSLGKSTMQMITWQMNKMDVEMAPDNFDIKKFAVALNGLLGEGAEMVLNLAYANLCRQLKIDLADPGLPALDKINRVLETKKMN